MWHKLPICGENSPFHPKLLHFSHELIILEAVMKRSEIWSAALTVNNFCQVLLTGHIVLMPDLIQVKAIVTTVWKSHEIACLTIDWNRLWVTLKECTIGTQTDHRCARDAGLQRICCTSQVSMTYFWQYPSHQAFPNFPSVSWTSDKKHSTQWIDSTNSLFGYATLTMCTEHNKMKYINLTL